MEFGSIHAPKKDEVIDVANNETLEVQEEVVE